MCAVLFLFAGCYNPDALDEERDKVEVRFDSRWGAYRSEGKVETETIYRGALVSRPKDPTRPGYLFFGWYDNEACTGTTWYFYAPILENTTLYAKWDTEVMTTP